MNRATPDTRPTIHALFAISLARATASFGDEGDQENGDG